MTTRRGTGIGQRLVAGLIGLMLVLTLLPRPVSAEEATRFALTKAQDAHITETVKGVKEQLELGKKPEEVREQAALAIQASLTASYAKGLDQKAAEEAAVSLVKAYTVNPGATRHALDDQDSLYIEKVKNDTKAVVESRLPPRYSEAVVFTAGYAAQDIRQVLTGQPTAEGADSVTNHITASFKDLPPRTDPHSPFHTDEIAVKDDAPPVQASAAPAPQPVASASAAPPKPDYTFENPDPNGITIKTDDGRTIVRRLGPDGVWVNEDITKREENNNQGGSTQLEVKEQNLNAGQNNNNGNSRNRTGSDDGKKDEKPMSSSSSSGNGNSNNGGTMTHHK